MFYKKEEKADCCWGYLGYNIEKIIEDIEEAVEEIVDDIEEVLEGETPHECSGDSCCCKPN